MFNSKLCLIAIFLLLSPYLSADSVDIISYDFKLDFTKNKNYFECRSILEIKLYQEQDKLYFRFNSKYNFIDSIFVIDEELNNLEFNNQNDSLIIELPENLNTSNGLNLCIDYKVVRDLSKKEIEFYRRENKWYPIRYDDPAIFNLDAITQLDYKFISIGESKVERIDDDKVIYHWNCNKPITTCAGFHFNKNDYKKMSINISGIPMNFYYLSTDTLTITKIKDQMVSSFDYYNELFGDFNFNKIDYIEIPDFKAAQSLPSIIIFGSMFVDYFNNAGFGEWPSHEMGHEWNGHSMFIPMYNKSFGRGFLEEGLTEQLRRLYISDKYGSDSAKVLLDEDLRIFKEYESTIEDIPIMNITFPGKKSEHKIIYNKTQIVLDKFISKIGITKWKEIIKLIYVKYKNKPYTFDDFVSILNEQIMDTKLVDEFCFDLNKSGL